MSERTYDVVLYGASGFTGQQTVQYFADHAPDHLKWAIAGRNRQKLEAVRTKVGCETVDILVADGRDQVGTDAIATQTRIVLTTAGPFALYGQAMVDACVRSHTHYVDITGETAWVRSLIETYHEQAATQGTRIIPLCGFDSVPSDLGAYLMVRYLQQLGKSCKVVKAYFEAAGGFNGGTLASAYNLIDAGQWSQMGDPYLLNPPEVRPETAAEDLQWSQYDQDLGAWVAPFFMGPVNTRVVRRSSALYSQWQDPYGSQFTYQESLVFQGPLSGLKATVTTVGTGLLVAMMQQPWVRRSLLQPNFPQPGEGPSEQVMDEGWFRCQLLAIDEEGGQHRGLIYNPGDPGNRSTVKFLCESALALALDFERLPGGPQRGGVLTPATGLGDVLADRLRQAGTTIEVPI
ncbi:Putative trans-acting enoyl reductase [Acaryochloris thomasi RCC1774]|uniref:Trans-acting enoyl reductase n=1 Tax=Acaryochloris thomasi RCC1774 TaxID=1764569 RepID=A0A2W1JVH8_9CYAN|nr:saccharopine dehydrogenase NADP-binding domain-containing protein [Acaryochloris thomasi]PZD72761.1 Putative trans-acting enoyl reductase [Acaryochloris thomasi RCC1774]